MLEDEAPNTEAPNTEAPNTEAPNTEAPNTEAPNTEAPAARSAEETEADDARFADPELDGDHSEDGPPDELADVTFETALAAVDAAVNAELERVRRTPLSHLSPEILADCVRNAIMKGVGSLMAGMYAQPFHDQAD